MVDCRMEVVVAAAFVLASGCASQQQTGKALQVTGTAAVLSGAVLAAQESCGQPLPSDPNASPHAGMSECRPNGSRQAVGAAIAAAGMGVTALGAAIEEDANRLDALKRSRASANQAQASAQLGGPSNSSLLALPPAPFSLKRPAPGAESEEGAGERGVGDSSAAHESKPSPETSPCPESKPSECKSSECKSSECKSSECKSSECKSSGETGESPPAETKQAPVQ